MNGYVIEHHEGGKWWTAQMGWKPRKEYALTFRDVEGARDFIKENLALTGSNIVVVQNDGGPARPDAAVDYNPFGYGRRGRRQENE